MQQQTTVFLNLNISQLGEFLVCLIQPVVNLFQFDQLIMFIYH